MFSLGYEYHSRSVDILRNTLTKEANTYHIPGPNSSFDSRVIELEYHLAGEMQEGIQHKTSPPLVYAVSCHALQCLVKKEIRVLFRINNCCLRNMTSGLTLTTLTFLPFFNIVKIDEIPNNLH